MTWVWLVFRLNILRFGYMLNPNEYRPGELSDPTSLDLATCRAQVDISLASFQA